MDIISNNLLVSLSCFRNIDCLTIGSRTTLGTIHRWWVIKEHWQETIKIFSNRSFVIRQAGIANLFTIWHLIIKLNILICLIKSYQWCCKTSHHQKFYNTLILEKPNHSNHQPMTLRAERLSNIPEQLMITESSMGLISSHIQHHRKAYFGSLGRNNLLHSEKIF